MHKEVNENLINLKEERNKVIHRIDVLDKVKHLLLIPYTEVSTTKQVADFYVVNEKIIQKIYNRHKDELEEDGLKRVKIQDFTDNFLCSHSVYKENVKGKSIITLKDGQKIEYPNSGMLLFPKRAILRVGMLLRDSEIAKEVRTQLLNIEEHSSNETKSLQINKEMEICSNIVYNILNGNTEEVLKSFTEFNNYKNRHIKKLEEENEKLHNENEDLSLNNKTLSEEILTWNNRKIVNKVVRTVANRLNKPIYEIWNYLYDELLYKHSIGLKARGKSPYIQHIKEEEYPKVISTLTAICQKYNLNFAEIVKKEL